MEMKNKEAEADVAPVTITLLPTDGPIADLSPPDYNSTIHVGPFPAAFNLYDKSMISTGRHYRIALPQTDQLPLFAVETYTDVSSSPELVLHAGPTDDTPWLAQAKMQSRSSTTDIELADGLAFQMKDEEWYTSLRYSFALPVLPDGIFERFEWRYSHSEAVRAATGTAEGYKLVRIERSSKISGTESSDGGEIVAASGHAKAFKGKKVWQFQFLGSGLAGDLGDTWAVGTVATSLSLFIRLLEEQDADATTSSSAAAASAAAGMSL